MRYTYQELAKMIDHSLLHPTMTDHDLEEGCKLAARYGVASVCIKPYAVKQAAQWLQGSDVIVGCVIGFPHGNAATESKRYETELACQDGAREIDMVVNLGKAMSGDWDYVGKDIRAVCDEAHRHRRHAGRIQTPPEQRRGRTDPSRPKPPGRNGLLGRISPQPTLLLLILLLIGHISIFRNRNGNRIGRASRPAPMKSVVPATRAW
jgi:hypothetical protein